MSDAPSSDMLENGEHMTCAICLEDRPDGNNSEWWTTACNHHFHRDCMESWRTAETNDPEKMDHCCPVCRTALEEIEMCSECLAAMERSQRRREWPWLLRPLMFPVRLCMHLAFDTTIALSTTILALFFASLTFERYNTVIVLTSFRAVCTFLSSFLDIQTWNVHAIISFSTFLLNAYASVLDESFRKLLLTPSSPSNISNSVIKAWCPDMLSAWDYCVSCAAVGFCTLVFAFAMYHRYRVVVFEDTDLPNFGRLSTSFGKEFRIVCVILMTETIMTLYFRDILHRPPEKGSVQTTTVSPWWTDSLTNYSAHCQRLITF